MKDAPEDANRIRNGVNHRKNDWDGIPGATPVSQGEYVFTRILTLTDRWTAVFCSHERTKCFVTAGNPDICPGESPGADAGDETREIRFDKRINPFAIGCKRNLQEGQPMIRWMISAMVYLGSALMVCNIYGFIQVERYIRSKKTWNEKNYILYLPIVLLIFFLIGYLVIGFFGQPDLMMAGVLFGGSIFVFIMYRLLNRIIRKVIESEHLEAELLAAEESNRTKSGFLAAISHEMRTPMNVILGMDILALKDPGVPEQTRDRLEKIGQSGRLLSGMINDLLDLQEQGGTLSEHREPFSLKEALDQINAVVSSMCEQKSIQYLTSVAPCVGEDYIGDASKLKRALMNILDNAVKFTDAPGYVRFCVDASQSPEDGTQICFLIADTGVGIDEEFLPKIFEPFTQEDKSFTNRFGGSGLGLSAAHRIVTGMGGTIEVESRKGEGTAFTVTIPMNPVPEKESGKGTRGEKDDEKTVTLEGRRILIAEDLPENAEIAADLLELENAVSERAENGLAAVNMVKSSPEFYYDAILMDLRMPVMDGLEAAGKIRSLPRPDARLIPIIALSANAYESDRQNSLKAGMNAHLVKPVDAELLYAELKKQIRKTEVERGRSQA